MNDERILVDSNFFIALFNPNDSLHDAALGLSGQLERSRQLMIISNFIFDEVVTVLAQRVHRRVAIEVGKTLQSHPFISMVYGDTHLHRHAWDVFCELKKKNTSFVDCVNIAILNDADITTILTFDREDFSPLAKQYHFKLYPV